MPQAGFDPLKQSAAQVLKLSWCSTSKPPQLDWKVLYFLYFSVYHSHVHRFGPPFALQHRLPDPLQIPTYSQKKLPKWNSQISQLVRLSMKHTNLDRHLNQGNIYKGRRCSTACAVVNQLVCITCITSNLRRLHRSKNNHRNFIVIGQIIGSGKIDSFMCIESII